MRFTTDYFSALTAVWARFVETLLTSFTAVRESANSVIDMTSSKVLQTVNNLQVWIDSGAAVQVFSTDAKQLLVPSVTWAMNDTWGDRATLSFTAPSWATRADVLACGQIDIWVAGTTYSLTRLRIDGQSSVSSFELLDAEGSVDVSTTKTFTVAVQTKSRGSGSIGTQTEIYVAAGVIYYA